MSVVKGVKTRADVYPSNEALHQVQTDRLLNGKPNKAKPQHIQISDEPGWPKPVLNVTHFDGTVEAVPISKRAAAVLMAYGMGSEG